jgi:hypothetical protein
MIVNRLPAIHSPLLFSYCEAERKTELAAMKQQLRIAISFFPLQDGFAGVVPSFGETQNLCYNSSGRVYDDLRRPKLTVM